MRVAQLANEAWRAACVPGDFDEMPAAGGAARSMCPTEAPVAWAKVRRKGRESGTIAAPRVADALTPGGRCHGLLRHLLRQAGTITFGKVSEPVRGEQRRPVGSLAAP